MSQPAPSTFAIPPSLTPLAVPMSTYLASHPTHTAVLSGVLVFTKPKPKQGTAHAPSGGDDRAPPKILLLQRASHDFMPHLWETPGGSVDSDDATILHGAARELWEEAGLRVTAFRAVVGAGEVFGRGGGGGVEFAKVSFWADVEGLGDGDGEGEGVERKVEVEVKIDPDEHQRFVWASEEECRASRVGSLEIEFTSPAQRRTILEGFRVWKADREG